MYNAVALPHINSFGSNSKFRKNKDRQFKYDRNQRIIKERKLIDFQRRSIEKMSMNRHLQSREDYGITNSIRDKTGHYFHNENAVKILSMDSLNSSKDNALDQRKHSRNSQVMKTGNAAANSINNWSSSKNGNQRMFMSANQTPTVGERSNLSVDDKGKSKNLFSKWLNCETHHVGSKEQYVDNQIIHSGMEGIHDKVYMSSIIQSKSLSNELNFNALANRRGNNKRKVFRKVANIASNNKYGIDLKMLDKNNVQINNDVLDINDNLCVERRPQFKAKPKQKSRKFYSNNNSIIQLQQADEKRYETCKTRMIPSSECSSPKVSKSNTDIDIKDKSAVSFNSLAF